MSSNDRMLDLLVVGLGGAGGRIAVELAARGYPALTFDPSSAELDALASAVPAEASTALPRERRIAIGLEGHRGTGGEPEVGARCVRAHSHRIRDAVRAAAAGTDGVLVVGGLGGGTGSALACLLEVLGGAVDPVLVMATLPTQGERTAAKVNAARAARELIAARPGGLIFVDNARIVDLNAELPLLDYHRRVNASIVEPLDALNRLSTRGELSAIRAIDRRTLRGLLFGGGLLTYGVAEVEKLDVTTVTDAVVDSLYASLIVASGIEPSAVSSLAIAIEAPDAALKTVPVRFLEELREQWRADTGGASVEVGVYRSADAHQRMTVRVVASCTELPTRLPQLVTEAASEQRTATSKRREAPELDLSELDACAPDSRGRPRDLARALAQDTPARRIAVVQAPREEAGLGPLPKLELDEEATRPRRPDAAEVSRLPGRAAYARIVTHFQSTTDEGVRQGIADRLERDRSSPHAALRYHAVDAMAKLGVPLFENALIAASEDPDPAVRTLANRAIGATSRVAGAAG